MDARDCCRYLWWDSEHFGARIGCVNATRLTAALLADIDQWASSHSIDCLYFLAEPDPLTMRLAACMGFRFVDARVTFEAQLPRPASPEETRSIRLATLNDIPDLRRIAGESHRDSRFYVDGNFPPSACGEMYRVWIERSCREPGLACAVFVAERERCPVGYISCRVATEVGHIGLVAVDGKCRNLGLGARLVCQALSWFGAQGVRRVAVVTQGSNVPAQRLYQKSGFLISSVQLWYHRWFRQET
ncbi:MAG: GNAT family N-acetyltransferase [Bryobacteraceae bacterium]